MIQSQPISPDGFLTGDSGPILNHTTPSQLKPEIHRFEICQPSDIRVPAFMNHRELRVFPTCLEQGHTVSFRQMPSRVRIEFMARHYNVGENMYSYTNCTRLSKTCLASCHVCLEPPHVFHAPFSPTRLISANIRSFSI